MSRNRWIFYQTCELLFPITVINVLLFKDVGKILKHSCVKNYTYFVIKF